MRPWLWMPATVAHCLSSYALRIYGKMQPFQTLTWSPLSWQGLDFTNRLGLAGGIDKDALDLKAWWTLGPGFVEVGTVTPQPQPGHRGYRMGRDTPKQAIWNRMGFPSRGVEFVAEQLQGLYRPHFTPIFVNVGKNATTPLEKASQDYIYCMKRLAGKADTFVVNLSSPNTAGLRELLKPANLRAFLEELGRERQEYGNAPIILKVSPDMAENELADVLDTSLKCGIQGWILTNSSSMIRDGLKFPNEGGVSGKPLASTSKRFLQQTIAHLGTRRKGQLIVSVGGVITPNDVFERIDLGADLVQVYSALVFAGPFFFRQVADFASTRLGVLQ